MSSHKRKETIINRITVFRTKCLVSVLFVALYMFRIHCFHDRLFTENYYVILGYRMVKFRALFVANLRLQSGSNTLSFSVLQHHQYLQKRYVSSSKYNKLKLIQLATFAQELKLETWMTTMITTSSPLICSLENGFC